ncbi:MAG TPA: hypothetical protein VFZ98_10885 [Vicinamibacterales bacterium]
MGARDLTKSALSLPWAISMFGVQQVANLVGTRPSQRGFSGAADAFDAVSDAAAEHLDGWMKQTYSISAGVQDAAVDLLMLRPPQIDSGTLMRTAADMQSGLFDTVVRYGLPPVAWVDSFLVPRRDSTAVYQEFDNKRYIIALILRAHGTRVPGTDANEPLAAIVDRAATMETFPRLWGVEGIGYGWADRAWERAGGVDPTGLLTDAFAASVPPWSLTMLHAGIGMSFARKILHEVEEASTIAIVRDAIARFVRLCRNSSRPGYTGAAFESFGLATRTLYPKLVGLLDREIPDVEPALQDYFWHGVGRSMYLDPMNMLPSVNAPWRVIQRLNTEAPHPVAYRNALSGVAWALTVVNMRQPFVMEAFLRHHADLARANDAFVNGVASSLLMRYDTTRDDARIASFIHHCPSNPTLASAWRSLITAPCEDALRVTYGELSQTGALEELFHYRSQGA